MAKTDENLTESMKFKPLHEVMTIVTGLCTMQFENKDVAIPVLVGDGGIGKTAHIQTMCNKFDFNLLDIHYGLIPLEEVSGIPDFSQEIDIAGQKIKNTKWTLPDVLGKAWELASNNKPTVVFLDDFHASSPGNMALGYEIFTEKKLRGYPFPPKTAFILAMNCSGAKSLANNIPAPIVNRLAMFKVKVEFDNWKRDFAIPNKVNSKILGFLSNTKNQKFFQEEEVVNSPWASARAWTKFSTLLTSMEQNLKTVNFNDVLYYASSHVGDNAASEFATYYKIFSEIPVEQIFDRKIPIEAPSNMSNQYIFMLASISEFFNRFKNKKYDDKETVETMVDILIAIGNTASEITVAGMKEILLTEIAMGIKAFDPVYNHLQKTNKTIYDKIVKDIEIL